MYCTFSGQNYTNLGYNYRDLLQVPESEEFSTGNGKQESKYTKEFTRIKMALRLSLNKAFVKQSSPLKFESIIIIMIWIP